MTEEDYPGIETFSVLEAPTVSDALPMLAQHIMTNGTEMASRGGARVMEITHPRITLTRPWERAVVVAGRRASLPAQIAETMWVLAGRNDVEWLGHYLPRASDFSDDGQVWRGGYGPRLRRWERRGDPFDFVDQVRFVLDELRHDPTSRRAVVNIYDPDVDTQDGKDIPCNDWLHFLNRRGALDLHVATRSNDLIWGWSGINAFEWSALQEILAGLLGLETGRLHFSISSLHIYDRHWSKARRLADDTVYEDTKWEPAPRFNGSVVHNFGPADRHPIERLDDLIVRWFEIEKALRDKPEFYGLNRTLVRDFPEPMLRSWLQVIAFHWSRDVRYLTNLSGVAGTPLYAAALDSPRPPAAEEPKEAEKPSETPSRDAFADFVVALHEEKHAAYGDSWKRRGEQIGILANVARKVDRLGVAGAGDTAADTAIDLAVYLAKYRLWLTDEHGVSTPEAVEKTPHLLVPLSDYTKPVEVLLRSQRSALAITGRAAPNLIRNIQKKFDDLEKRIGTGTLHPEGRAQMADDMLVDAWALARYLWRHEQNEKRQWGAGDALEDGFESPELAARLARAAEERAEIFSQEA